MMERPRRAAAAALMLGAVLAHPALAQSDMPPTMTESPAPVAADAPATAVPGPLITPNMPPWAAAALANQVTSGALSEAMLERLAREIENLIHQQGTIGGYLTGNRVTIADGVAKSNLMLLYMMIRMQQYGITQVATANGIRYVLSGEPTAFETFEDALRAAQALSAAAERDARTAHKALLDALGPAVRGNVEDALPERRIVLRPGLRVPVTTDDPDLEIYVPASPEAAARREIPADRRTVPADRLTREADWVPDDFEDSIPVMPGDDTDRPIPADRRTVPVDELQRQAARRRVMVDTFVERANGRLRREALEAEVEVIERARRPALPPTPEEEEMLKKIREDRERRRAEDQAAIERELRYLGPEGRKRRQRDEARRRAAQAAEAERRAEEARRAAVEAEAARRAALSPDERAAEDFRAAHGDPRPLVLEQADPNLPGVSWRIVVDPAHPNRVSIYTKDRDHPNWVLADAVTMDSFGAYSLLMRIWNAIYRNPTVPTDAQIRDLMAGSGINIANMRLVSGSYSEQRQAGGRGQSREDSISADFAFYNTMEVERTRTDEANHYMFLTVAVQKTVNGQLYEYEFSIWLKDATLKR